MIKLQHNAKSIHIRGNNMNILKLNVAVFSSLLFLLFAVVDTAAGGDYADGKLGKALILDGSSHTVKIPHYAALKPAKTITISAWIKPARVVKGFWEQHIYRKEDGNARTLLAIGEYKKKHCLMFGLGIGGKYGGLNTPLEPAKLLDGKWHLVCATYDGKAIKLYADGQEIGSAQASGAIDTRGEAQEVTNRRLQKLMEVSSLILKFFNREGC